MADIIVGLITAVITGFIIGIVVLAAQFTIDNIGTIIVLGIIGAIAYFIYQILKPSQTPIKKAATRQPAPKTPMKQYKMPKALKSVIGWGVWFVISYIITTLALVIFGFLDHSDRYPVWAAFVFSTIPFMVTILFYLVNMIVGKHKNKKRTSKKS